MTELAPACSPLAPIEQPLAAKQSLVALARTRAAAIEFAACAISAETKRAYAQDWKAFCAWASSHSFCPLPAEPETIWLWCSHLATEKYSCATINRQLSSIGHAHKLAGEPNPCLHHYVRAVLTGIRKTRSKAPERAAPLLVDDLRKLCSRMASGRDPLRALRDRALILIGWMGAFRRSELVAVDVEHLDWNDSDGLRIYLPKSKTDQTGQGAWCGIPYSAGPMCAVRALRLWLDEACISQGPVFRGVQGRKASGERLSDRAVDQIIRTRAARAGLGTQYSAHSLKSGVITAMSRSGAGTAEMMGVSRHKAVSTLLMYIRGQSPLAKLPTIGLLDR